VVRAPLVAILAAAFAAAPASAQPTVRVRAETRIELQVVRGRPPQVSATLRDDRGNALAGRDLRIRIAHPDGRHIDAHTGRTDGDGRVGATFEVEPGTYQIEARFGGEDSYTERTVSQRVDLERAHVRLALAPERGRLDHLNLDEPVHPVRVRVESEAGGAGLDVRIENELGDRLAEGRTGADSTVRLELHSDALGAPAAGRLVVRTQGDAERAEAQTEVPVVRYRPTTLTLTVTPESVEAGRAVRVEGALGTSEGPLPRKAIGIFAGGEHVETVLTDGNGELARDLVLSANEGDVSLEARFDGDAPWRPDARSEPQTVRIEPRGSTPLPWLLLPIGVCTIVLVALWWRGRRRAPESAADRASRLPAPPGIVLGAPSTAREPGRRDVGGLVLDADEADPLVGAHVTLSRGEDTRTTRAGADGRFELKEIPDGRWVLRVEHEGYEGRDADVEIPHRGRLAGLEVRLRSLRQIALRRYAPLAEALAPSRRWWAFWTPRELASRASRGVRSDVEDLTQDVEEAAYGAAPPRPDDVDAIGRRSDRLAGSIRDGSTPR